MDGEDRFFEKNGDLTLRYRVAGEGPPVTLNHGVGSDLESWDEVVPVLSPHFTVLRYDMRGHGGSGVRRLAFSPDGKNLACLVGDHKGTLHIWHTSNGKLIWRSDGFHSPNNILFAPDGQTIALTDRSTLQIYRAKDGRFIRSWEIDSAFPSFPAFSSDGNKIAVTGFGATSIWLYEVDKFQPTTEINIEGGATFLRFHRDGKRLVIGNVAYQHFFWDLTNQNKGRIIDSQVKPHLTTLAVSNNFGYEVTLDSRHRRLSLWALSKGKEYQLLQIDSGKAVFSKDSQFVAIAQPGGTISIWHVSKLMNK